MILLLTISSVHAETMKTWNCEASIDSSTVHESGIYVFEQQVGKDYAWWTLNEGIEDAFDVIVNDGAYVPCNFNKVKETYVEIPNNLFWTTHINHKKYGIVNLITGDADIPLVSTELTKEDIKEARNNFADLAKAPLCNLEGYCSEVVLCSYSCNYGE